jgi:hypothetical protein
MLHGLKDEISNPTLAKDLFNQIPSTQKIAYLYPNGFHELFNDLEADKYKKDLLVFMNDVLVKNPPAMGHLKKTLTAVGPEQKNKFGRRFFILGVVAVLYLKGIYL